MSAWPRKDVNLVRDLARRCVELSCSDEYEARRARWRAANERRKGDRAPVWCRPAGAWREILPPSALECEDEFCRSVEYVLRQHLYKDWVGDDHIFEPWWPVPAVWDCESEHVWGLRTGHLLEGTEDGGFRYEHPVQGPGDYDCITVPSFSYNVRKTEVAVERMQDLLGQAMEVRVTCEPPLGPDLNYYLVQLRGMEGMLEDLAFQPHVVHRAMAKLMEGCLAAMRAAESSGMLTTNHHLPMYCSEPVGEQVGGRVGLHNLWVSANSQEFQVVSPAMTEEFLLNYQIPLLQQYGAVQYGCCEDLTQKIAAVLRIPNLRIFVCSAWTDLDKVIEACGRRYTIMWRQPAAAVVHASDIGSIKSHLEVGLGKLTGYYYQVVLREIETLGGHPERLREWARTAIELAEKFA
ncbi:MAG: hypothetical protein N2512_14750 [Armatimonadetes bacterium]|nr:hypothetical protein [Armatimonadota bacterium]